MPIGVIVSCVSLHWINSWLMHVPRSFFGRRHNLWCRICSNQPLDNNVVLPKNYKCTCCCVVPRPLAIQIHDATAHSFNSFPSAGQCNAMRQQPAQPNQYLLLRPGRREWGGLTMHIFAKSLCEIEWGWGIDGRDISSGRTALFGKCTYIHICLF